MSLNTPKLQIHCITYNHEKFIADTLKGFVKQKTNFPFEAIVADDCSTDNTRQIISVFADKYPHIIKPVFREKNIGVWGNFVNTADLLKSQYVAMCEGDDYWTDPNKLQKQVDFLDAHPDCSLCFHPVKVNYDKQNKPDSIFPSDIEVYNFLGNNPISTIDTLLKGNFIQTNSVVYRWRFHTENMFDVFPCDIMPIDYFMHILHAQKGHIFMLPDIMAVYRKHAGGVWSPFSDQILHNKYIFQEFNFIAEVNKLDNGKYKEQTKGFLKMLLSFMLLDLHENKSPHKLIKLKTEHPEMLIDFIKLCREYKMLELAEYIAKI
ncbi:glycosyltransferase [Desulfovibrio litoralis]|uniref:Glycosyltransferase involved in cell wall bisynthesis n=1 Tax=Desulfovibrio litoralis DSM 11393 TaxID=1121455 RepID=A0A1M7TQR8_9BACT|nr:glycosyltransferase [Desulfovibrio litoralis]SHN72973.1 Glycosyltransferase involved in cell wall bisynthesis [Desulfovibrio litoralis DSM 11393]